MKRWKFGAEVRICVAPDEVIGYTLDLAVPNPDLSMEVGRCTMGQFYIYSC